MNIENKKNNLPKSLIDFLNYLSVVKNKSEYTVIGYRTDLSVFFRFMITYKKIVPYDEKTFNNIDLTIVNNKFLKSIDLTDLYAFLAYLDKDRKNGAKSKNRKIASVKSYFKFICNKIKIIKENPTLELESCKLEKRNPIYMTLEQCKELLNTVEKNKENYNYYRDYCIIVIFLNCGLRVSELTTIKISDIKNDILSVIGKGNKERTIYLNNACLNALNNYLPIRAKIISKKGYEDSLFLSVFKAPIGKKGVEHMIKQYMIKAGLDTKYTPHKLRHTMATLLYKYGEVDIRSLQQILGHSNVSTTQIYTHCDESMLRNAVNNNPLANILSEDNDIKK